MDGRPIRLAMRFGTASVLAERPTPSSGLHGAENLASRAADVVADGLRRRAASRPRPHASARSGRCRSQNALAESLGGGNQQKLVLDAGSPPSAAFSASRPDGQ
jgi:hypothetical protein